MKEIKECENCGNENIEIINRYKGHYLCGKCGRDTEKLYEIEHDAEIRAKAIDEFISELYKIGEHREFDWEDIYKLADQLKGGAV